MYKKAENIFESIPDNLAKEAFETIVQSKDIKIERIISRGHTSPETGWYDQEKNEWVMILKGDAIITFENEKEIRLNEGSYLNITAHTKHRVSWTSQKTETIWLAIFYSD